jgi:hypothetical protein
MKATEHPAGAPCWAQLSTNDLEASKAFYGGLLGWTAETSPDPQFGGYTQFMHQGQPVAAVAPLMNPQQPVMWLLSFASDDVDAGCEAATAAGAQVWNPPMEVGDLGRWALLSDPTGSPYALWQKRAFGGFGLVDEPFTFGWADLGTKDAKAATEFYATSLGWRVWPSDDYPMVGLGERMFGGIMTLDPAWGDVPSHWTPYFVVPDVDATAAKAAELGGEVMHGPVDVEMENGPRLAGIRDPHGGMFGVFTPKAG